MQTNDITRFEIGRSRQSVSGVLRRDIDEFFEQLRVTSRLMAKAKSGELTPDTFGRYLRSIHYLLTHTPIHLSLAEATAREKGEAHLARYFAQKKAEEDGHEKWAADDISSFARAFGVHVPEEPTAEMRQVVDTNCRTILEEPLLYLAYVLFAEYSTIVIGPEWIWTLAENCGISGSFLTAVGNHVELDKGHVEEGCREIDEIVARSSLDALRAALGGVMERFAAFCDGLCGSPTEGPQ